MALKLSQCLHRRVAKEAHTHLKESVWSMSQYIEICLIPDIYVYWGLLSKICPRWALPTLQCLIFLGND